MIWIISLALVAGIVWLYQREMKKRAEWKMEYRYLTRHQKDDIPEPLSQSTLQAESTLSFEPTEPAAWMQRPVNQKLVLPTAEPVILTFEEQTQASVANDDAISQPSAWKSLQSQMKYRLQETSSMSVRRGQDLFAVMQKAVHQNRTRDKNDTVTPEPDGAVDGGAAKFGNQVDDTIHSQNTALLMPVIETEVRLHDAQPSIADELSTQQHQVIDVPDLNEMVFNAAQVDEQMIQNGYALLSQENDDCDRWSDDVEDDMRQEITLEEINARRARLQARQQQQPTMAPAVQVFAQEIIAEQDVAHVIRAIKEDDAPMVLPKETIAEQDVAHVIQSIKADTKAETVLDLEVIELPAKDVEKSAPQRVPLATISMDEIQQQQHILQAKAQKVVQSARSKTDLETIHLPDHHYQVKQRVEKVAHEVIEFPDAVVKKVTPKAAPQLQTIVLTEEGLQTVQAKEPLAATMRSGRAASDTALLHAMVEDRNQAMIADDDIRTNLLRQRMARRRGHEAGLAGADLASNTIIAEEEVLANLAKTDSPINRQQRAPKPRPMVRDSVIPPTSRVGGEHGFKVKPQAVAAAPAAPISTRFTPFSHQELQSQADDTALPISLETPHLVTSVTAQTDPNEAPASMPVATALQDAAHTAAALATPVVKRHVDLTHQVIKSKAAATHASPAPTNVALHVGNHDTDGLLPSVMLLNSAIDDSGLRPDEDVLLNNSIIIEEKLAEFKVNVTVTDAYAGPVITRYEIEPATGVRGSQVVNLEKDLARSLGFASIRVVETIPGKTCMGLELPNPKRQIIRLSSVLQSVAFQESKSKLTLVLGQDISGNPVVTDLGKAPHLLVAGTTGSGKSVGVNAMILSLLYKATPDEVRMIMIDPKMLELSVYEGIPHLLAPVVTDMKLAANALNWCVNEMEKRYRLMSHLGVRNVAGYNQKIIDAQAQGQRIANPFSLTPETPELLEKLPFIVVVVDEFADLMMTAGKKIEELIARLAQKARAAGIHLILATQRPSVDVITGLIKANIPTRIAFQVSSKIDSRTILDQMGAENLLGQGDMLFLPPGTGYPRRVHGAFVADDEVHHVVEYLKQFGEPDYVEDLLTHGSVDDGNGSESGNARAAEEDPLYDQAVHFVATSGKTSISAVQRQLRIGYNRAARLVEQMEAAGVLSAPEHNGNRILLIPQQVQ